MEKIKRAALVYGGLHLILGSNFASHLIGLIYKMLIDTAFSRDDEYEADESGFRYLVVSGHDPKAAITALEKLKAIERRDPSLIDKLLMDHPPTTERIDNLRKAYRAYKSGELELV